MTEIPGKPVNLGGVAVGLPQYTPVDPSSFGNGGTAGKLTVDEMIANIKTGPSGYDTVPASVIPLEGRYNAVLPYTDTEEMAAQQQSAWDKWGNGLAKMTGTAATTFISGTVGMLAGLGAMARDQRFSSFYDNDFNRSLDEFNKQMENSLPNYYTHAETDADWYSPSNVLTANFFSDKVVKNLGFSVGALAGGFAWGGLLKSIGLTNRLVQAGKGMEAVEAVENALISAPKAGRFGAVSEALANASTGLKPFAATALKNSDRAIVSVMGTMGEASLEALQNINEFRDHLINDYIAKYGERPQGSDLDEINQYADKVGNFTWGMNVALLSATNYIQLPKILNTSKTAESRMRNEVIKAKVAKDATLAEKIAAKYKPEDPFLQRQFGRPGKLLNNILKPSRFFVSPTEAFEEGAQFAIQMGVNDYFSRAYENQEDITGFFKNLTETFGNVISEGVSKTLSTKEGLESMLIGSISGGLQTSFSPFGDGELKQTGFFGQGGVKGRNTDLAVEALNKSKNLTTVLKDAVKYAGIAITSQKRRQAAIEADDTLEEKDYEQDYTLSYILPRVKYGKIDAIKEELGLYKTQAMSDAGFKDLQAAGIVLPNETQAKFLARLQRIEKTADSVQKTYEMLNDKYSAIFSKDGKALYSSEVIDKLAYASAKILDYDERLKELSVSLSAKGVNSFTIASEILEGKTDSFEEKIKEIESLKNITSDEKIDRLKELLDLQELALRRSEFLKQYDEIKNSPAAFKGSTAPAKKTDAEGKPIETITLKTKTGDKEVEIGEEYFLGRIVEYDKNGKEVYRAPKLTILGENEDGSIKIRDSKGVTRDVSKSVLEDYKLSKVSTASADRKAKFFMENWNTIYEYKVGGNKKPLRGRLEYSGKEGVLLFVYKDSKGKRREIEITRNEFKAQPGYSKPRIEAIGTLTAVQQQAEKDFKEDTAPTTSTSREARLAILSNLFDEIVNKQTATKKLLEQKKAELKDTEENLKDLQDSIERKSKKFKGQTRQALEAAMRLSRTKRVLEYEIEELEDQSITLEINANAVADLASNMEAMPSDTKQFVLELKNQRAILDDLVAANAVQIAGLQSLIDKISDVLESAIDLVKHNIEQFEKKYPKAPLAFGQEFIDFLQENPNFLKLKPDYVSDLKALESFVSQVEDLDITPNERSIKELQSEIASLTEAMEKAAKQLAAKDVVIAKFKEVYEKWKKQKQEERAISVNKTVFEKFLGTHTTEQPLNNDASEYEPEKKKNDNAVLNGTVAIDDGKPHQKRANDFGINYRKLKNKAKLRMIELTAKTQEKAGAPGLIEHLLTGTTIDKNTVVVAVVVQDDGNGKFSFVNEKGEKIQDPIKEGIYQVRPTEKLTMDYSKNRDGSDMQTMFRASSKEREEELRARYAANRALVLASEEIQPMKRFSPSFGILKYEQTSDKNGKLVDDFGAKNSVLDTELVSEDDLVEKLLLEVPTINDPTPENGVSFKDAIGRVFLRIAGTGMLKLNTNNIGKKKAEAIYSTILQVAKNIQEDPKKGVEKSAPLFSWLKSVIYWGIQKDKNTGERKPSAYNSVWFEKVEDGTTRLFISGKGENFMFTPSQLEAQKEYIIATLAQLYHNVSNAELRKGLTSYREIVGFNNGNPVYRDWENYQTYLLTSEDLPLTTPVLSTKGTDKQNREGIYFVLQDNIESEVLQKENPPAKTEGGYVADGKTVNTFKYKGKEINFVFTTLDDITLMAGGDLKEVSEKTKAAIKAKDPEVSDTDLRQRTIDAITKAIRVNIAGSVPAKQEAPKKESDAMKAARAAIFGKKPATKQDALLEEADKEKKADIDKATGEFEASLNPPLKEFNYLTNKQLAVLDSEDMLKAKKEQDKIKEEYKILEDLRKCLWKI